MISDIFKNLIYDPVSVLGILVFYILLVNFPISLIAVFTKESSFLVRTLTILVNFFITLQLIFRWSISGHFPISNLYESLYFLTWGISMGQLLIEREYKSPIIPSIAIPIELLTVSFACFVLPDELKLSSNLVPALRSSWLVMHVSVVMLSYAALIIGSLLSASVLFLNNNESLQIRSSSSGTGGFKISNKYSLNDLVGPIEFSHSEELDTLSYRSILIGFVLLTLGLISGAVWANEAWGTWWSWDPKETWAKKRLVNGEVIKVEAHPIPEHPRPRRVVGRMALVGDAAGYVTKSSGEGIYFAAKSGRMCAEEIVEASKNGQVIPSEKDLKNYLKKWDKKYGTTYKVLEILQNIFYRNDSAREAFVEMCDDMDVQRLTFDSYLYKKVVSMKPLQQLKITMLTLGSILRGKALAPLKYKPVDSAVRENKEVEKMLENYSIKGGIKVKSSKV